MRTMIFAALAAAVTVAAVLLGLSYLRSPPSEPPPIVIKSQGPTIERLEKLSKLVTTKVYIADVLTGEGPDCKGVWLIRGDALIAVDLGKAAITEKDEAARRATILLLPPEVLHPRVDHSRTRTWAVESTSWVPWGSQQDRLRDEVMKEGQLLIEHAASSSENIQQAKLAAETLIRGFYAEVGWSVSVAWASPNSPGKPDK